MLKEDIYNNFIANGDYAGAANYLSRGHFKDPNKQRIVNETIKQLRSEGRKLQGMMERADVDQKAAFSFINSINNNSNLPGLNNGKDADGNYVEASNIYSKYYSDAKRNLASTNNHEAESVSVKFGGKTDKRYGFLGIDFLAKDKEYKTDAFTEMLHRAGISKQSLISSGAKITVKDGQYYLNISKRNNLFNRVYNALLKTKSDDGLYRLTETKAPTNYDKLSEPIYFTVKADHTIVSDNPTLESFSGNITTGDVGTLTFTANKESGILSTKVVNKPGSSLPETGGMGTTILYVAGAVMILAAGAFLVMQKKAEDK